MKTTCCVEFVVMGRTALIQVDIDVPLSHWVARVLLETGNIGQPAEAFEVRAADGLLLDQSKTPAQLDLFTGSRLFVSPRAGVGGAT